MIVPLSRIRGVTRSDEDDTLIAVDCPSCHASIDVSGVFPGALVACASCGAKVRASAPSSSSSKTEGAPVLLASTCPCCPAELVLRHHDAHVVSACPEGHGLFVTRATLKEIQNVSSP